MKVKPIVEEWYSLVDTMQEREGGNRRCGNRNSLNNRGRKIRIIGNRENKKLVPRKKKKTL